MDVFHCRSILGFEGPTVVHESPQIVRDTAPLMVAIWSRWTLLIVYPLVDDNGIVRDVVEGHIFRNAFKY